MTRIAVIADTHIGVSKPNFVDNWRRAAQRVNDRRPDLTVILGDLTFDGANSDADCAFAREALADLKSPCLVLPGNHDVGDTDRGSRQPANAERLARWVRTFGADRWVSDEIDGWRLIGLNAQILGTGLPEEIEQWRFLEQALVTDRRTIVFTHQPLFLEHRREGDRPYWASVATARHRLLELTTRAGTLAILSAHMHRALSAVSSDGPALFWVPATSFLTRDTSMPPQNGAEMLGVTYLDLTDDGFSVAFDPAPGLEPFYIEDFNGTLYPAPSK
ncbi:metallophosphoesterase [Pleomorphomonas sp. PLEO]|uniref:metallophosphoesterase family protein n=1 Tax=Pleomorphomonas sp. PLEO TaxID=3239306 RepID=UPI00351DBD6E